jgi:hypothetical protein
MAGLSLLVPPVPLLILCRNSRVSRFGFVRMAEDPPQIGKSATSRTTRVSNSYTRQGPGSQAVLGPRSYHQQGKEAKPVSGAPSPYPEGCLQQRLRE